MQEMCCDACGRRLPENPWMRSICSSACVDRFADALVTGRVATPPAVGGLDAFLAEA